MNERGRHVEHFPETECFRLEIEQFNRAIEGRGEPMTTAAEGLRAKAVAAAAYEAVRSRRVVEVAEFLAS
jgi:predicted dehydrogenase